jgi:GNAT superfamily N-acetyltransferase
VTELRDLVIRWQRGWGVARGVPAADDVGGGLRVRCEQPGRDIEYVAFDTDETSVRRLAQQVSQEDAVTWLSVPTTDPLRAAAVLEAAGLVLLRRSEMMMTTDLHEHPRKTPAAPYRLDTHVEAGPRGAVVVATVRHGSSEVGARGTMGLAAADAVADRIETMPGHRRRGLASAIMSALAGSAIVEGAERGILVASEEGRRLYAVLGWRPVATVLIATTPDNG